MRGRFAPVGLVLAAMGLAGCGQSGPQIQETLQTTMTAPPLAAEVVTISPTSGPPYTPITLSGANCTGPNAEVLIQYHEQGVGGAVYRVSPDAAGNWSVTMFAAPVLPPGSTQIDPVCETGSAGYAPVRFVVTPGEQASSDVQPRFLQPGVATTLTVSGTACHAPADGVGVTVLGVDVADARGVPDATGAWTIQIPVPPQTPHPGSGIAAEVHTACLQGTQVAFGYEPVRLLFRALSFTG